MFSHTELWLKEKVKDQLYTLMHPAVEAWTVQNNSIFSKLSLYLNTIDRCKILLSYINDVMST